MIPPYIHPNRWISSIHTSSGGGGGREESAGLLGVVDEPCFFFFFFFFTDTSPNGEKNEEEEEEEALGKDTTRGKGLIARKSWVSQYVMETKQGRWSPLSCLEHASDDLVEGSPWQWLLSFGDTENPSCCSCCNPKPRRLTTMFIDQAHLTGTRNCGPRKDISISSSMALINWARSPHWDPWPLLIRFRGDKRC